MENETSSLHRLHPPPPAEVAGPHTSAAGVHETARNPPAGHGPEAIGLYGLGHYTLPIVELCRDAGIRVAFVVDDCPDVDSDSTPAATCLRTVRKALYRSQIPVWTNAWFCSQLEQPAPLPTLIASSIVNRMDGSVSSDPYLRSARLVRELSAERWSLLHPVILAHALSLPAYRKRVALFGFPGSGNILAKHLIAELWGRLDAPPPRSVELTAAFAEHYYISTVVLVRHLLRGLRPIGLELASMQFPTLDLTLALPENEYAQVQYIPGNRHLGWYFYHTHMTPTRLAVDELTRLGARCIAVVRHPCETILSWASKVSRPPTPILDREDFFGQTVLHLAEWHRQLIAHEDRCLVVRYEDLAARQRRPLQLIAERLGVGLREQEIDALYDRFLDRDLQPEATPAHYYHGGSDKWKQYFLRRHVRQMMNAGFDRICRHWGYDLALPADGAPAAARGRGGPSGRKAGMVPLGILCDLKDRRYVQEPFPLLILSNSREITEALRAALHGLEFLDHLNAAGLGPASPPWVAPIPWRSLASIFHPEEAETDQAWPRTLPLPCRAA